MKVTVDWLKKYVFFSFSADELSHQLTMLGLEVESIRRTTYNFSNVIIGQIKKISRHPQKDNLSICEVNVGKKYLRLICGAPNVRVGLKVPVALVRATLPNNIIVEEAMIHGYESLGMICSEAELGLSHQSDIVMELENGALIGDDLKNYLGEGETIIEINVTPNRPDCLGVIGVAREIAAISNSKLNRPQINLRESSEKKVEEVIKVTIKNPESCPRYTARFIQGVKVAPSPWWLVQKLETVGIRTINNVVDVTNFVMMETGQPLHAFDYNLLENQEIIVRHAYAGEKFIILNEQEHILSNKNLLICDGKKPIALAGVMGGFNSEITNQTQDVLLESALFDPLNIRRTAKSLSLSTDSSQRFERGVDPQGLVYAINRAAELINELAGGVIFKGVLDSCPKASIKRTIELNVEYVNNLLGTALAGEAISEILSRLEFSSSLKGEVLTVDVPTFRVDIERDVDLIEEVSRMHGFDSIESKMFATIPLFRKPSLEEKFYQLVREYLIRLGYNEIITHSLIKKKFAEMFSSKKSIRLSNPISEDLGTLRTSVLPGALQILKWNKNRKVADQQLFEIGNIFYLDNEQLDSRQETKNIALLKTGNLNKNSWVDQSRSSTIYDLKGDVVNFLNGLGKSQIQFQEQEFKFLKRNEALSIQADESEIGYMGSLSQSVLKEMDIDAEVFVAELNFEKLMKLFSWENKAQPVPKYPSIQRDLAIVVDQMIPWHKAEKIIWDQSNDLLKSIELFDLYRGKQIAPNQKSFAFTLTYQSLERTLTEKEVDTAISRVLENLKSEINAHLRT